MANWLEDILNGGVAAQRALMAAYGTGGMQAPASAVPAESAGVQQVAPPQQAQNPLLALLQNATRYQQKHGDDPLAARVGMPRRGVPGRWGRGVVQMVTQPDAKGLDAVGQVTTQGARAGQAHTSYDLGDGRRAHVYFDDRGRRQVFVFTPKTS